MASPDATAWTESEELRNVIDRLPREQREVLLHYLAGYSSAEIAQIVQAPAGTIRYRLAQAREQLRQGLCEDDLNYLNEPLAPMRQWAWLPLHQMFALETHLARDGETREDPMERRRSLDDLAGSVLRVEYTLPGEWRWKPRWGASWLQSVVPATPGMRAPRPLVRARTREEALQEARRLYASLRESMLRAAHRTWPEATPDQLEPQESHIVPTELGLTILYMPGAAHTRAIQVISANFDNTLATWPGPMSSP